MSNQKGKSIGNQQRGDALREKGWSESDPAIGPAAAFRVALPTFEGPLDLLLHLIREHRIDIFDIPIALITEKYWEAIKEMKKLNLDIAGEFILMAATLAHIKSRMLLPTPDPQPAEEEQAGDPREELVRRLLEYQKYKAAAEDLGRQDVLNRNVFTRRVQLEAIPIPENEVALVEVSVFKLVQALDDISRNEEKVAPHKVVVDSINLGEAIHSLLDKLRQKTNTTLLTVLQGSPERQKIVVTFLALLEMCKLGIIRISQSEGQNDIQVSLRDEKALDSASIRDDYR